jgi:patatin-like phospholipase/acyl hydrolase
MFYWINDCVDAAESTRETHQFNVKDSTKQQVLKMSPTKLRSIPNGETDDPNSFASAKFISTRHSIVKMIDSMFETSETDEQKANILIAKAEFYYENACDLLNKADIDRFRVFHKALTYFKAANRFDKQNSKSIIGVGKCLLNLHKYKQAFDHFRGQLGMKHRDLCENWDFWFSYAVAARKCAKIWLGSSVFAKDFKNMDVAHEYLHKVIEMDSSRNDACAQKKILYNLMNLQQVHDKNIHSYVASIKDISWSDHQTTMRRTSADQELYKILSIDGSGIKGVLSSFLLAQIEKRSKKHVADLFDMHTGTGVGAVFATGLNVPEYSGSNRPLYSMGDLLETIYLNDYEKPKEQAQTPSLMKLLIRKNPNNRTLFDAMRSIVKDYRMSESLNELCIPTVSYDNTLTTHYFTRYDARQTLHKDVYMVDACMATSVIMTYAQPHRIKNFGCFMDGGHYTQSACKKAYEDAINRLDKSKDQCFVLSLGTGLFATDYTIESYFSVEDMRLGHQNNLQSIITSQVSNAETFLGAELGDRFRRFEVYLEDEISMDLSYYMSDLIDIATEYIEEKTDQIDEVVEILLEK